MRQIFLLILLFIVGQWLVKGLRRNDARTAQRNGAANDAQANQGARGAAPGAQKRASGSPQLPEPMIRCAECGVHAPKSDSIVIAGQPFCCTAHAQRHASRPTGRDAR
ncbi:PP0621 family protein [Paraburkholderia sp.]|uniref:PP0621 family protein n=1 Tax=Paraburkholderia sp. TaxID=1926495 RepID=UPI002389C8DA|nr:PP0621 family protein [Paraburkholderia sp.]MDE1183249.1 PP0621 family protein [Paraburkholderia sp.]